MDGMNRDTVPTFFKGEKLGAGKMNQLGAAAGRIDANHSAYSDATGIYPAPPTVANNKLVRFCAAEDHPGRGVVFEVYIGTWNPATHNWTFPGCTTGDKYKCIDWFYSDTAIEPDAGFRGWGYWEPSNEHGKILVDVTSDCDSPEACCS